MKRPLISILLTIFLTGCWQFDNDSKMLVGNYNIGWVDNIRWQTIMYDVDGKGLGSYETDPYIFAVGHNDKYIIAKQHPLCKDYFGKECMPDQSITNYFIIDVIERTKIGPLSETEFSAKKKQLDIETLEFDIIYPEIPND